MKSEKLKRLFVGTGLVVFFTALSFLVGYMEDSKIAGSELEEASVPSFIQHKTADNTYKDTVWLDSEGNVNKYTLTASVHEMTNYIIIADLNARWDAGKITQDKINRVYDTAFALDDTDKDKAGFIDIAERWKKQDFGKAVEDHNFVWGLLGGSIGKATGINEEALQETLKRLEENK